MRRRGRNYLDPLDPLQRKKRTRNPSHPSTLSPWTGEVSQVLPLKCKRPATLTKSLTTQPNISIRPVSHNVRLTLWASLRLAASLRQPRRCVPESTHATHTDRCTTQGASSVKQPHDGNEAVATETRRPFAGAADTCLIASRSLAVSAPDARSTPCASCVAPRCCPILCPCVVLSCLGVMPCTSQRISETSFEALCAVP